MSAPPDRTPVVIPDTDACADCPEPPCDHVWRCLRCRQARRPEDHIR